MRKTPLIWTYVKVQDETHLELANAGLKSGLVFIWSGLKSDILLYFNKSIFLSFDVLNLLDDMLTL